MTKRSSAKKAQKKLSEFTSEDVLPPNKKRKTSSLKKQREHGGFCKLNPDVLFLIAQYVYPIDLLNLARTCKSLRARLMDKSALMAWRAARRQVEGLPKCPADLSEPEFANLVFFPYCHGCGKSTKHVSWEMRRRYCPNCRNKLFCPIDYSDEVIRENPEVLGTERSGTRVWVDVHQRDLFVEGYNNSSDKDQFIDDRLREQAVIRRHARQCKIWQQEMDRVHDSEITRRRADRDNRIFELLEKHGYGPEISYFKRNKIREGREAFFRTSRLLTDREWARHQSEWLEIMNDFRDKRLNKTVYLPRRLLLKSAYQTYVQQSPPQDTPQDTGFKFELLPHVADVARFAPFRDIINAPEEVQLTSNAFDSAFTQLPALIETWRKKLDVEVAELVKIPSHLSSKHTSQATSVASSSESSTDRLRPACAQFTGYKRSMSSTISFAYPEVLLTVLYGSSYEDPRGMVDDSERSMSDRFGIRFVEEAPYIVYACGLDPHVATVEDMDRRNARVRCLACKKPYVRSWRNAMWHSSTHKEVSPCWEAVGDEYVAEIQAVELSIREEDTHGRVRCLLCRRCVGDVTSYDNIVKHLYSCHELKECDIKRDVHWEYVYPIGCRIRNPVEMVEEGGQLDKVIDNQVVRHVWQPTSAQSL